MCGICGYISSKKIDAMLHRGSDGSGEYEAEIENGKKILGLAHRRLGIIDCSLSGRQPMQTDDGRIIVTFDGEIYNLKDLKEDLSDYPFCSQHDTEVIIASYLKWGIDCIKRFQGMFAIALYDKAKETLFLIRDRIGKKPLYYWQGKEHFVFASELKPIMEYPYFNREINKAVMGRYLFHQYIAEPDSVFKEVYKLEPGSFLTYHRDAIKKEAYFTILNCRQEQKKHCISEHDFSSAKAELKTRLIRSISKRLDADSEVGVFLSGGYDSALVASIAAQCREEKIKTFSIGFDEALWNEAEYAKAVSKYLGTEHHERYFNGADVLRLVECIPKYYDEPFADASQLPSMLLAETAAKKITVALSGDGADEFFGGYQHYETVAWGQKNKTRCDNLYDSLKYSGSDEEKILNDMSFNMKAVAFNRNKKFQVQFGSHNYLKAIEEITFPSEIPCRYDETKLNEPDWRTRRMLLDEIYYLPSVLGKVERASMRSSLKVRCPFLDTDIVEYAWRLPQKFKSWNGKSKIILKDICHDYIPERMMDREKKGFTVPLDKWLRGQLKEQLITYSRAGFLKNQGIFTSDKMEMYVDWYLKNGDLGIGSNHSRIIWPFFVFQKWYGQYIKKIE